MANVLRYPEYSWSYSRGEQFDNCQRSYFYSRYETVGGNGTYATPRSRLMYGLSRLSSLPLWKGNLVHFALERYALGVKAYLEEGNAKLYSLRVHEAMVKAATNAMRKQACNDWERSLFLSNPKNSKQLWPGRDELLLQEHYEKRSGLREETVREEVIYDADILVDEFARVLYNLLTPDSRIFSCELLDTLPGFKAKVYIKSDLVLWRPDQDLLTIIDWKSGRVNNTSNYTSQLALYALWASQKFDVPPMAVSMLLVHPGQLLDIPPLSLGEIETVKKHVARSIAKQMAMLAKKTQNVPKPLAHFEPCSPNQSAPACRWCAFKKFCAEDCAK